MNRQGMWRLGFVLILSIVAVMAGCAKKQTVRSDAAEGTVVARSVNPAETAKPTGNRIAKETENPNSANVPKNLSKGAGVQVTEEVKSPFADIHFDFDKSFIKDGDKPDLQTIATYLKQHPDGRVRIEGNCDERGTAEYNMALGERRAESAKKYLTELGVSAGKISMISFGKEKPLDPGHTEEAWAKNRRDHFDKL